MHVKNSATDAQTLLMLKRYCRIVCQLEFGLAHLPQLIERRPYYYLIQGRLYSYGKLSLHDTNNTVCHRYVGALGPGHINSGASLREARDKRTSGSSALHCTSARSAFSAAITLPCALVSACSCATRSGIASGATFSDVHSSRTTPSMELK